jgi:hypothetical protein
VGSLAILGFTNACATPPKSPKTTPYNIIPFKPDYFVDTDIKRKHLAIFFTITGNGRLILLPKKAELRPGPFPYQTRRGGGDTKIVYLDSAKEEIGHYYIENPTTNRECYGHPGSGRGKVVQRTSGKRELLIPANDDIAYIDIIYPERFDVRRIVTDGLPP